MKITKILYQVSRSLLYIILFASAYILRWSEVLSYPLMGGVLLIFQVIVLIKYPTWISFFALILSYCVFVSFQLASGAIKAHNTLKIVIEDVFNRYPDCSFCKRSITELVNVDSLVNFSVEGGFSSYIGWATRYFKKSVDRTKIINLIYIKPSQVSKNIFAGGQAYRTDFALDSFVFLNPSKHILNKFVILHEIGHLTWMSSTELIANDVIRESYLLILLWLPLQVEWSFIVMILFIILLIQMIDYWRGYIFGVTDFSKLNSEIYADNYAAINLSTNEKEQMLSIIRQGYLRPDPKFLKAENAIRMSALAESLNEQKLESLLPAPFKPGNTLSRFILIISLVLFVNSPTYKNLIEDFVLWIILSVVYSWYTNKGIELNAKINKLIDVHSN